MRLVCHIGTPKTGSTLLQTTCKQNKAWLAGHGVYYPNLLQPKANHLTLFAAVAQRHTVFHRELGVASMAEVPAFRERVLDKLDKEIQVARRQHDTMLISSENLSGRLTLPAIQDLSKILAPRLTTIEILVYLRRQDDCLLSLYAEGVKRGFTKIPFSEFVTRSLTGNGRQGFFDYRFLLARWAKAFGREQLDTRLFEKDDWHGGDLTVDFMTRVIGSTPTNLDALRTPAFSRTSLSAPCLKAVQNINRWVPYLQDGKISERQKGLQEIIRRLPTEPKPNNTAADTARIMQHFAESNAHVKQMYFPGRPGPLFPERTHSGPGNMGRMTVRDAAHATVAFARASMKRRNA